MNISPPFSAIEQEWRTAKECRMFDKFFKTCVKCCAVFLLPSFRFSKA